VVGLVHFAWAQALTRIRLERLAPAHASTLAGGS
jgi:hypothetical protein